MWKWAMTACGWRFERVGSNDRLHNVDYKPNIAIDV
jgi:hypothetical protein